MSGIRTTCSNVGTVARASATTTYVPGLSQLPVLGLRAATASVATHTNRRRPSAGRPHSGACCVGIPDGPDLGGRGPEGRTQETRVQM